MAEDGSKEAVEITFRDLVTSTSIGLSLETTLALLGRRSSPPCIDCLALINARFSRWEANATSDTTIRASISSPSAIAPITAIDVRTWNPITRFFSPAMASLNNWFPAKATPPRDSAQTTTSGICSDASKAATRIIRGIVRTAARSWIWSFLNPDSLTGESMCPSPSISDIFCSDATLSSGSEIQTR